MTHTWASPNRPHWFVTATSITWTTFALADPLGRGQQLSGFLRLPAALRVGGGVASSAAEIEALPKTLTDHVVEVTQTRLTNVYDSVEAYNESATGVSVPYHVLVLAGFPGGITTHSAELLARLARNGPRAGVYLLATAERGLQQDRRLDLAALAATATGLHVDGRGIVTWDDPDFGRWVIEPDVMPPAQYANSWLDAVGAAASVHSRDLPFARIAIPAAQRWSADTTDGLDVQIGVDSKGEPQHFVMGSRGVHNRLVGGDVRMGKSNLLHVLITQLALKYPPEELELYLLDFKEVEFDAYLTQKLPHARAITSRTDREFGLSMLRRFHDEIERRARLCREAKVTQLPEYRRETGEVVPRSLVVMDEFQVLFSEEDRLSREAGALLARREADLAACQRAAVAGAAAGRPADCSAEAMAVREAQERLDYVRRRQQRVEEEAGTFRGTADRFRELLDLDLPRTENHLLAIISGLQAARGLPVTGS